MRRAERRREVPDEALSDTAVADVRSSMAKRLTTEQQAHLAGLTKDVDKKKQKLADDADPDNETRKKRLKKEESLAATRTAVADGVQRKTFYQGLAQGRVLKAGDFFVVTAADMVDAGRSLKAIVKHHDQIINGPVKNLGLIAKLSGTKTIV